MSGISKEIFELLWDGHMTFVVILWQSIKVWGFSCFKSLFKSFVKFHTHAASTSLHSQLMFC